MASINSINNTITNNNFTVPAGTITSSGNISTTAGNLLLPTTTSTVGQIQINASRVLHSFGTDNFFAGTGAGNFTLSGTNNTGYGPLVLDALSSGNRNSAYGYNSGTTLTTGSDNTLIGYNAGTLIGVISFNTAIGSAALATEAASGQNTAIGYQAQTASNGSALNTSIGYQALLGLTTGDNNTSIGHTALSVITTGSNNTALGYQAGISLTVGDSSNIMIKNAGIAGDNNTIRIGTTGTGAGQQNQCFLAGAITFGDSGATETHSLAAGAGIKTVTLGSTTTSSSLALKYGTADFTLASATGTVMSALDTGEITYPLQSAFLGYLASSDLNRTGNGTTYTIGTNTAFTEVFDQNSDFNTNGTFTAPVTGRYQITSAVTITGVTIANTFVLNLVTSNRTYRVTQFTGGVPDNFPNLVTVLADFDAADTWTTTVTVSGEAGLTDDILGSTTVQTYMCGYLAC